MKYKFVLTIFSHSFLCIILSSTNSDCTKFIRPSNLNVPPSPYFQLLKTFHSKCTGMFMVCLRTCFCVAIPITHYQMLKQERLNTDSVSLLCHYLHSGKHFRKVAYFCQKHIKIQYFRTPFNITVGVMPLSTVIFS